MLSGRVRFVSGALHVLNSFSLRYTSKGPVVFAIFLLWPRDSVLHLSSPIPSPGTQVRDSAHTESPFGGIRGLGRASLICLGAGEVGSCCCGLLAAPRLFPRLWLTWSWDRSWQDRLMAARKIPVLECFDPVVAGEGSKQPQSRSGCPAAQLQPRCRALLVADVTVTQMLQCPLL